MQKTILKYVTGLSENASAWERRNHKKYGSLNNMCRLIEYDLKHGATLEQVLLMFKEVRNDDAFSDLRKAKGSIERLNEVEDYFTKPKKIAQYSW